MSLIQPYGGAPMADVRPTTPFGFPPPTPSPYGPSYGFAPPPPFYGAPRPPYGFPPPPPPYGAPRPPHGRPGAPYCARRRADPDRTYISRDPSVCETYGVRCPSGTIPLRDACGCGCETVRPPSLPSPPSPPPVGRPTPCPPGGTGPICTAEYRPTCGCRVTAVHGNQISLDCRTYSNPCQACAASTGSHYRFDGACPGRRT
ncbi:hypothetical protein TW95_gp1611 [Pandoravirus inopinatum]|uniref:Kazal-like domain-containing protein n=1 Tax=Pandoravirus inopinatum TaxID=1605721 RepID=A0A0B5J8R6_9VIRU|nr:hypothetical protein TW95_gp1611 [Pandoravirus inopinatum]AJF98345.1 hypothetical protein [Pandoravirus inopinatum]